MAKANTLAFSRWEPATSVTTAYRLFRRDLVELNTFTWTSQGAVHHATNLMAAADERDEVRSVLDHHFSPLVNAQARPSVRTPLRRWCASWLQPNLQLKPPKSYLSEKAFGTSKTTRRFGRGRERQRSICGDLWVGPPRRGERRHDNRLRRTPQALPVVPSASRCRGTLAPESRCRAAGASCQ